MLYFLTFCTEKCTKIYRGSALVDAGDTAPDPLIPSRFCTRDIGPSNIFLMAPSMCGTPHKKNFYCLEKCDDYFAKYISCLYHFSYEDRLCDIGTVRLMDADCRVR